MNIYFDQPSPSSCTPIVVVAKTDENASRCVGQQSYHGHQDYSIVEQIFTPICPDMRDVAVGYAFQDFTPSTSAPCSLFLLLLFFLYNRAGEHP